MDVPTTYNQNSSVDNLIRQREGPGWNLPVQW